MYVGKGTIQQISGSTATVIPDEHPEMVTLPLVVPFYWRETMGNLKPGEKVYYIEDNAMAGYIIGRTNGDWDNTIRGELTVTKDVSAGGISLVEHTHTGNMGNPTSPPTQN